MFYFHKKFKNHQSKKLIKGIFLNNSTVSFDEITRSGYWKSIEKLRFFKSHPGIKYKNRYN